MTTPLRMPGRLALDEAQCAAPDLLACSTVESISDLLRSLPTHDWESVEQAMAAASDALAHYGVVLTEPQLRAVAERLLGGPKG